MQQLCHIHTVLFGATLLFWKPREQWQQSLCQFKVYEHLSLTELEVAFRMRNVVEEEDPPEQAFRSRAPARPCPQPQQALPIGQLEANSFTQRQNAQLPLCAQTTAFVDKSKATNFFPFERERERLRAIIAVQFHAQHHHVEPFVFHCSKL